jgi:hypothetical protein
MKKIAMGALLCAGLLGLAGCGGGSDEDEVPTTTFNVQAAFENLLTTQASWDLDGEFNGTAFELTLALDPASAAAFPGTGEAGLRTTQTITIDDTDSTSSTVFFDPASFELLGATSNASCSYFETQAVLPTAARVGDGGTHRTSRDEEVCNFNVSTDGSSVTLWSLRQVSGTVFLCFETTQQNGASVTESIEEDCVEINEAGSLGDKASVRIEANGNVIAAAN